MEAPKELTLYKYDDGSFDTFGTNDFVLSTDEYVNKENFITYIRKDIYDEAQAHIKELEKALREYANGNNWSRELDLGDSTQYLANSCIWKDDTQGGSIIARKYLEKVSEG